MNILKTLVDDPESDQSQNIIKKLLKSFGWGTKKPEIYEVKHKIDHMSILTSNIPDYAIAHMMRQMYDMLWKESILPNLDKKIILKTDFEVLEPKMNFFDPYYIFKLTATIKEYPKDPPVIYRMITGISQVPNGTLFCEHCDGFTKNDEFGNCLVCDSKRPNLNIRIDD